MQTKEKNMNDFSTYLDSIIERFGIDKDSMTDFVITQPNRKHLSFYHCSLTQVSAKTESIGVSFAKHKQKWPKLSTGAARVIGKLATKNIVSLNRSQADFYMKRLTIDLTGSSALSKCESTGYVIVIYENNPIGVGMLKYDPDSTRLCSLYPKNWKKV